MVLSLERFSKNFGVYPVPQVLKDLLGFQNTEADWYSDSFELAEIGENGIKRDFGDDKEVLSQFLEFGHDGNYSIYALWLYKDMPLEEAPVVYFNSEGVGNTVVANNLTEFLTLLAFDEELILGTYPDTNEYSEHTTRNQAFRAWIRERYHLQMASQPNEVIQKAQSNHPDLELWIAARGSSN